MTIYVETVAQEAMRKQHAGERLEDIDRIRDEAPEHHKADIDRLWELVRDAAQS